MENWSSQLALPQPPSPYQDAALLIMSYGTIDWIDGLEPSAWIYYTFTVSFTIIVILSNLTNWIIFNLKVSSIRCLHPVLNRDKILWYSFNNRGERDAVFSFLNMNFFVCCWMHLKLWSGWFDLHEQGLMSPDSRSGPLLFTDYTPY